MKMRKQMIWMAALAVCMSGAAGMQAQTGAASAHVEPAKSFDAELTDFEGQMMGVAKAMPADKYDFAPSAAIFVPSQTSDFKGVRTFGAMVLHIAQANYYYAGALSGMKPDVDLKTLGNTKGKDAILAVLQASFVFTHKAIATLTVENAFNGIHGDSTRASLAGGVVAHGFDHYGQLVEYLRMNGIVPPASQK